MQEPYHANCLSISIYACLNFTVEHTHLKYSMGATVQSNNIIHTVSCHAEDEVGDVITAGVQTHLEIRFGNSGPGSQQITL